MPHRPEPWYREPRQTWFVQIDGKQIPLAKGPKDETESAAYAAYFKLMAGRREDAPPPTKLTVRDLCERFLDFSEKHHSKSCYDNYRHFLDSYCERYGGKLAHDQKVHHVTAWLDAHPTWKGARRHAILAVKRAFSWAEKQDLITSNPLRKVPQESGGRRPRVLTKEEQAEILAAIRDEPFRQFVRAMLETGARSSEVERFFGFFDWDRAKELRKTLISSFLDSRWRPGDLAVAAGDEALVRKIIKRLCRKRKGEAYLAAMVEDLVSREDAPALAIRDVVRSLAADTGYYEPWD